MRISVTDRCNPGCRYCIPEQDATNIKVDLYPDKTGINAESEIRYTGRTGAEIEALTAASVALLTVYDMHKAADKITGSW